MSRIDLLTQNLAIEPDLQGFCHFVLGTVHTLGGNAFAASLATLDLVRQLRAAGAGTGYPLPATLGVDGRNVLVWWAEEKPIRIVELDRLPSLELLTQIQERLRQSTEQNDPDVLLRRNAEMTRYLNETRERTERELEAMQQALERRQQELSASIRQAETDSLTGLLNRRAYDERLEQAFRRTIRQGETLSLILLDLDYFKQINDEHGHQYGDDYLKRMAQAMLRQIRHDVDFAFRFGGDEFAMVLFADKQIARAKALGVLAAMNNKVSIGVASVSPKEPCKGDLQEFIKRADNALYEAKRQGRGRVVIDTCGTDGTVTWEASLPEALEENDSH